MSLLKYIIEDTTFTYNPNKNEIVNTIFDKFWQHPEENLQLKNKTFNISVSL